MIKILFINAINPESEIETRYTPLGILYLSASLKKALPVSTFEIKLVNKNIEKNLQSFRPDIVGITVVSQNFNHAIRYAKIVRKEGLPTIVGGVHISMIPECITKDMDVGCIGEGELTIVELMKVFLEHKSFPPDKLEKIDGIVFWKNDKRIKTPHRTAIRKMDQIIPHPDRTLEGPVKHAYVFSSRGCPYRCVFCASSRYWNQVRFFSPEYVFAEVEDLVNKSGAKMISFYDDLFVANKKRLHDIAILMEQGGLAKKIKFTCSCRSNMVNEDIVADLQRMGVVSVGLGLESGNLRVLNYLKGKTVTIEDNRHAVKLLTSAGIKTNASFIIGSPDETETEMIDTYNFIRKNKLSFVDIYVLTPYPGTPVWDFAKSCDLVSNHMDWDRLNVNFEVNHPNAIILSKTMSRKRLYKIYKKFRRQRLVRNIRSLITHPMLLDLPKVASGIAKENIVRFFSTKRNR
ncbi:MAG: B12-binding domain-containing radical SAM protein [Deltaproteobacteria bacterium]|nr:B12-binding domain-containing radical SAM protein [Deltaproteobacteria bacterium]